MKKAILRAFHNQPDPWFENTNVGMIVAEYHNYIYEKTYEIDGALNLIYF